MIIRCTAPAKRPRYEGQVCDGYVLDTPDWTRPEPLGRLKHSSRRRDRDSIVPACTECGALTEIVFRGARAA